ncbi:MAG: P-loop NTPase, partial [Myxococcota bacterium]
MSGRGTVHQARGLRARGGRFAMPGRGEGAASGPKGPSGVIGVVSGKGGVGKSALAANVSVAAAATGARTLLVDGDLGLANADLLLGLVPEFDLADWCDARVALEGVACPGPAGLSLVVAGRHPLVASRLRDAIDGGEAAGLGGLLVRQDLVVLDLGAGIGASVVDLATVCGSVWLVATPEPTSLADAYATAKRLWERAPGLPIELVLNRLPDASAGERTHQALVRLTRRFLGRALPLRATLPEDAAMAAAVARQSPV